MNPPSIHTDGKYRRRVYKSNTKVISRNVDRVISRNVEIKPYNKSCNPARDIETIMRAVGCYVTEFWPPDNSVKQTQA